MLRKLLPILLPLTLFADEARLHEFKHDVEAWLTGPIVTPSGVVVQAGHYNIESYAYANVYSANYNNHWALEDKPNFLAFQSQTFFQLGLCSWADIQFAPSLTWQYHEHAGAWSVNDVPVILDFQLYRNKGTGFEWCPSFRFSVGEVVPVGKYRNLRVDKHTTDSGGGGSWITFAQLGFSNIHRFGDHFLVYRVNGQVNFPAPVHVKGFNAYGGSFDTDGTLWPGINAFASVGLEYTLTQNWVLALDVVGKWSAKNRFTGDGGTTEDRNRGNPVQILGPSAIQYSLAPAVEYNFSAHLGIIAGVWFSVAGKNNTQFNSGVMALNYYH